MKNYLIILISLFVFSRSFSQSTSDYYNWLIQGKIKKEKLAEAKLMFDIIPNFPIQYYGKIMDYVSVEISATCEGKTLKSLSTSEILTPEQKNILNTADMGTDIGVNIKFKYKDPANDGCGTGGKIKEIKPLVVTVIPEIEAEYPGGYMKVTEYLKESVSTKSADTNAYNKLLVAILNFAVNEEGKIIDAKILRTSTDAEIDKLLLEAAYKMPNWKPAQNSNGIKVKQEFSIRFRFGGC